MFIKIKKEWFIPMFIGTTFLISGCGSDRAGTEVKSVAGVNQNIESSVNDSDYDGLTDAEEINIYKTDPLNSDTDGDGLKDGAEVKHLTEATDPLKKDTDNDGLQDNLEVLGYSEYGISQDDLNATNPDTDGDCLLDSYEVEKYGTKSNAKDSDNDGIDDGIEIYSTIFGELNDVCLKNPETLLGGHNENPPKYNTQINALEPAKDSDGDGLSDQAETAIYHTDPLQEDSDGDGLLDGDEIIKYKTDPLKLDTDGDNLNDKSELFHLTEATNPLKKDTDNDGLQDDLEVLGYSAFGVSKDDLNATNPDTDGDCLLDSYEVEKYATKPNDKDSDADGVDDGIEIYSETVGEFNRVCLDTPEVLDETHKVLPAMDNIPTPDVINALDPNNDSDGDGQGNLNEADCAEGNPTNSLSRCPFYSETADARTLIEYGYSYIPGQFDVDGDGNKEGGFWLSTYQARQSTAYVNTDDVITMMNQGYNQYVIDNFELINGSSAVNGYTTDILSTSKLETPHLLFKNSEVEGRVRFTDATPYTVMASLQNYKMEDSNGDVVNIPLHIMSIKQYTQIRMLLEADLANGGDGATLRNGLLGSDKNIPLVDYSIKVHEFGENYKEYTSTLIQLKDATTGDTVLDVNNDFETWWDINTTAIIRNVDANGIQEGANSIVDVGFGRGDRKDTYAVAVMGGKVLDLTQGTAGVNTDDTGKTNGIGFRAASGYLD